MSSRTTQTQSCDLQILSFLLRYENGMRFVVWIPRFGIKKYLQDSKFFLVQTIFLVGFTFNRNNVITPDLPKHVPTWIRLTQVYCRATRTLRPTECRRLCSAERRSSPPRSRQWTRRLLALPLGVRHLVLSTRNHHRIRLFQRASLLQRTPRPETRGTGGWCWTPEELRREKLVEDRRALEGPMKLEYDSKDTIKFHYKN